MKRNLVVVALTILLVIIPAGCGQTSATNDDQPIDEKSVTTDSGLQFIDVEEGDGPVPQVGDKVKVHYTGTLEDGTKFDSSLDRGEPFEFTLGTGMVIAGWDEGIGMMKEGGKAKLIIPPDLAYGDTDRGSIPANSMLTFEVELVSVASESKEEPAPSGEAVIFPDENLEAKVREAISKPDGEIRESDLEGLTSLNAGEAAISDIAGLENCINLTTLKLHKNHISDISPLSELADLTILDLWDNQLFDISPLSGLVNLTRLSLFENRISDISPLSGLINLTKLELWDNQLTDINPLSKLTMLKELDLWNNRITDIAPLSDLTSLTHLSLGKTQIGDISPLSDLTSLTHLWLFENRISDITPLAGLTGLTKLYLEGNSISDISSLSSIVSLTTLRLSGNEVADISPLTSLVGLTWLDLKDNQISDVSALTGLTGLTWLELQNNSINDISPLLENTNLDEGDTVDLRGNPLSMTSIDEFIPQLEEKGVNIKK